MTVPSPSDPRPAPDLAQVAPVAAENAATVASEVMLFVPLQAGGFVPLCCTGIRHGRLGFGLGGGLS